MARKAKKAKKAPSVQADGDGETASKGSFVGGLVTLVVLAAASFGTVFMLPSHQTELIVKDATNVHASEEEKIDFSEETGFLELTPLTISLQEKSRILKIGITLETRAGEEAYIDPNDPRIRDAFMGYLRALRLEQIEDAAFMAQMRSQLLRRAKLILGPENIRGILITDFLVR